MESQKQCLGAWTLPDRDGSEYKEWPHVCRRKLVDNKAKSVVLNLVGEKLCIKDGGPASGGEEYGDNVSIIARSEDEQKGSSLKTAFGDEDDNEDDMRKSV